MLVVFFSCPVYRRRISCSTQSSLIGQVSLTSLLSVTLVYVSRELEWTSLASQPAQCNPCLSPECCNYKQLLHLLDFYIGSGDRDSNPHALEASDLYTEPPPQPLVSSIWLCHHTQGQDFLFSLSGLTGEILLPSVLFVPEIFLILVEIVAYFLQEC